MCPSRANASMYRVVDRCLFGRRKNAPGAPSWNAYDAYGPWTSSNLLYQVPPSAPRLFTRLHDLNVKPEQSGPSPPGSYVARLGVSSLSLSFQQPPAYWYPSPTPT